MKSVFRNFPFIFNIVYIIAIFFEVVILFIASKDQLNYTTFINSYKEINKSIFFIPIIGLVINILSYLMNLDDGRIMGGCLAGIAGFIVLLILPEYFYVGLICLWIAIYLFYRSYVKRNQRVINKAQAK